MKVSIAKPEEIAAISKLSVSQGNIPFETSGVISTLRDDENILGFAAVQPAFHAAGSWIHPAHRHNGYTYELRQCLEDELKYRGINVYFSIPNTPFERELFQKYGFSEERVVQVRRL